VDSRVDVFETRTSETGCPKIDFCQSFWNVPKVEISEIHTLIGYQIDEYSTNDVICGG